MSRPRPATPSLWPREHGAWFELGLPLVTGLSLGAPGLASTAFALAAVLAFLAHEPLLVALGQRGPRARAVLGPRAPRRAALLGAGAAAVGVAAMVLAPSAARWAALVCLTLGAGVGALVFWKREKTVAGELYVGLAFASALAPVAVGAGVALETAAAAAAVWALAFAVATFVVHATVANIKRDRPWARPLALLACAAATILGLAPLLLPASLPSSATALLPTGIVGLLVVLTRVHPKKLRALGWSLAATHGLTLALLIFLVRG